eukprot:1567972-Pyramimonas_sp.AAC.1
MRIDLTSAQKVGWNRRGHAIGLGGWGSGERVRSSVLSGLRTWMTWRGWRALAVPAIFSTADDINFHVRVLTKLTK